MSKFRNLHRRHQLILLYVWHGPLWTSMRKPYVEYPAITVLPQYWITDGFLTKWITQIGKPKVKNEINTDKFFRCFSGYTKCRDAPCENNATCSDVIGGYRCLCPMGYGDVNCSTGGCLSLNKWQLLYQQSKSEKTQQTYLENTTSVIL